MLNKPSKVTEHLSCLREKTNERLEQFLTLYCLYDYSKQRNCYISYKILGVQ